MSEHKGLLHGDLTFKELLIGLGKAYKAIGSEVAIAASEFVYILVMCFALPVLWFYATLLFVAYTSKCFIKWVINKFTSK